MVWLVIINVVFLLSIALLLMKRVQSLAQNHCSCGKIMWCKHNCCEKGFGHRYSINWSDIHHYVSHYLPCNKQNRNENNKSSLIVSAHCLSCCALGTLSTSPLTPPPLLISVVGCMRLISDWCKCRLKAAVCLFNPRLLLRLLSKNNSWLSLSGV